MTLGVTLAVQWPSDIRWQAQHLYRPDNMKRR